MGQKIFTFNTAATVGVANFEEAVGRARPELSGCAILVTDYSGCYDEYTILVEHPSLPDVLGPIPREPLVKVAALADFRSLSTVSLASLGIHDFGESVVTSRDLPKIGDPPPEPAPETWRDRPPML